MASSHICCGSDPLGQSIWHKPQLNPYCLFPRPSTRQLFTSLCLSKPVTSSYPYSLRVLVLSVNLENRCRMRMASVYQASQQGNIQFDKKIFYIFVWVSNHLTNKNPQSRWKRCEVQYVRVKKDAAHLKIFCLLQRQFINRRWSDVYMNWRITASYLYGATHHSCV